MMKYYFLRAVFALALLAASSAHATLIGEQVTGSINFGGNLTNYFDPANGFVPGGYLNTAGATVTIGDPAIEFGFQDGANRDVANFTDSQLIITDDVFSSATNWTMMFTSATTGLFQSLSLFADSFNPGLTYSLVGDTITVQWAGTNSPASFRAVFDVGTGDTIPEPGSLALLAIGLAGFGFSRRRKV